MAAEVAVSGSPGGLPYARSWVDLLTEAIERVPLPVWSTYLLLLAGVALVVNGLGWLSGQIPPGTLDVPQSAFVVLGIYLLALLHYLNHVAGEKMDAFRPALDLDREEYDRLRYELTTLPARQAALAGLAGGAWIAAAFAADPAGAGSGAGNPVVLAGRLVVLASVFALFVVLIYHTIRQLRLVARMHAMVSTIDLFEPAPLYAFSNLTARTGSGLVILAAAGFVAEPSINAVTVVSTGVVLGIAAAAFVLPLRGMHQRLQAAKEHLQLQADRRFKTTIGELHRSVDERNLEVADALNKLLASLQLEREALARIPTWPWQAGTLRAFISVLLVPIALWLIFRALERFV